MLLADHILGLGPDHLDILAVRRDLAQWRGLAGDVQGAAEAQAKLGF
ncbi:hypothetical protein ABZX90_40725 [Streptomyces sp. NPDC002935]